MCSREDTFGIQGRDFRTGVLCVFFQPLYAQWTERNEPNEQTTGDEKKNYGTAHWTERTHQSTTAPQHSTAHSLLETRTRISYCSTATAAQWRHTCSLSERTNHNGTHFHRFFCRRGSTNFRCDAVMLLPSPKIFRTTSLTTSIQSSFMFMGYRWNVGAHEPLNHTHETENLPGGSYSLIFIRIPPSSLESRPNDPLL